MKVRYFKIKLNFVIENITKIQSKMSAVLHCIVTSIENDRLKQLVANMRFNKRDEELTDGLNQLKCQLDIICPYQPYFELSVFHDNGDEDHLKHSQYDDDEQGKDELYDAVQYILNDEDYSGQHIQVVYVNGDWNQTERMLLSMTIP